MRHVPEIKLIRTDTTLDLSQKAEKVWFSRAVQIQKKAGSEKIGLWDRSLPGFWLEIWEKIHKIPEAQKNPKIQNPENICEKKHKSSAGRAASPGAYRKVTAKWLKICRNFDRNFCRNFFWHQKSFCKIAETFCRNFFLTSKKFLQIRRNFLQKCGFFGLERPGAW